MKPEKIHNICLFIVGPTASGKTDLSLKMADYLGAEIISADSRQVFRHMNIGTATPSEEELAALKHYFINTKDPEELFSAGEFGREARKIIADKMEKGENIIVCGGSGLYVQAALGKISDKLYTDHDVRESILKRAKKEGWPALYKELQAVDPEQAAKIDSKNLKRISRALEIWTISGQKPSEVYSEENEGFPWPHLILGIAPERAYLYERINSRVEKMIDEGLVEESQLLLKKGYGPEMNALNTVGYKEIFRHLDGDWDLETAISEIQKNTRHFAKRQMTWFRKHAPDEWIKFDKETNIDDIVEKAKQIVVESLHR
ncbi:MAG: tRNA (adenosine(37)-N6)-dimethylallyltransferase MiaA [Candidatus Neomarinimicrobiota bacterium]